MDPKVACYRPQENGIRNTSIEGLPVVTARDKRNELLFVTLELAKARLGNSIVDISMDRMEEEAFVAKAQEIINAVDRRFK